VGYLSPSSATKVSAALFDAFRIKLEELRYVEGKNLGLDVRRADDDYTRLAALAAALVSLAPNVIVGTASPAIAALQHATSSIPIIMAGSGDPVASGFVKSLAKPGGNITGLSNLSIDLTAKSLEILHAAVPSARRIAVLTSPMQTHETMLREAYPAAQVLGLKIIPVMARTPADLDGAFAAMHKENCEALFVFADPRTTRKIVELADQWRLPAIYQVTGFVEMGGLLSYNQNYTELFQQAAIYVDKILKGANPADLPVEQPTKFELQINLKTAKALGLTIPDSILARADRVIE
jgi:putative ABC transport system substrate-binding protein